MEVFLSADLNDIVSKVISTEGLMLNEFDQKGDTDSVANLFYKQTFQFHMVTNTF